MIYIKLLTFFKKYGEKFLTGEKWNGINIESEISINDKIKIDIVWFINKDGTDIHIGKNLQNIMGIMISKKQIITDEKEIKVPVDIKCVYYPKFKLLSFPFTYPEIGQMKTDYYIKIEDLKEIRIKFYTPRNIEVKIEDKMSNKQNFIEEMNNF